MCRPHAHTHGTNGEPSTYSRGTKRLDYVFVSPRILPFIQKCGIDPFHQVIFTDHCGLFLDLDLKGLLGSELVQIQAPKTRGFSSHTGNPEVYVLTLHQHLLDSPVFTTATAVFAAATPLERVPAALVLAINKLDWTITQGMLLAETRCWKQPLAAWSAALTAASRTVKFWKTSISGLATRAKAQPILLQIGAFLQWDSIPLLDTILIDAKAKLKIALTALRKC